MFGDREHQRAERLSPGAGSAIQPHRYPRPQLRRPAWFPLNGPWEFAADPEGEWERPAAVQWTGAIQVPYSPETPASGVRHTGFLRACWYRRAIQVAPRAGERLILHFGAVDHTASVWVNGHLAARHEGGYTPFSVDLMPYLSGKTRATVVVRAEDDPRDLSKPRGKQDWELEPHAIWYPRTTGIWQTVWMESVPDPAFRRLRWSPLPDSWAVRLRVLTTAREGERVHLRVRLRARGRHLAEQRCELTDGEADCIIGLPEPESDQDRERLLWSPESPTLISAQLDLTDRDGTVVDRVSSYTAMRLVGVDGTRVLLNGRPYPLRLVLDQGYWPESGLTAPGDEALRRDVVLAKSMGFNGVRKHQKIEDPRYLYWADRLGLVVWEEMPSAYRFDEEAVKRLMQEWSDVVERDRNHPCIVAWVPFNESWGIPEAAAGPTQRQYLEAVYHLTHVLDASRPVVGNDGWEAAETDIIGVHDYAPPEVLAGRYGGPLPPLLRGEGPAGRRLVLDENAPPRPVVLSEFGGVGLSTAPGTWGYHWAETPEDLSRQYRSFLAAVHATPDLAGFCYTQFADTYQEANGLLWANRTPKFSVEEMAQSTEGRGPCASRPKTMSQIGEDRARRTAEEAS